MTIQPPVGSRPGSAAAAQQLYGLVAGPIRPAEIVLQRPMLTMLTVRADGASRTVCLAAPSPATVRTAATVLLPEALPEALRDAGDDTAAVGSVGCGAVTIGGRSVRVLRWWPTLVRPGSIDRAAVAELAAMSGGIGIPSTALEPLTDALARRDAGRTTNALTALIGAGPGSTPSGDDMVGGVAVALRLLDRSDLLEILTHSVSPLLPDRTTALSAELLRAALRGHVAEEARMLIHLLQRRVPTDRWAPAAARVLASGHTSGADFAHGLTATLAMFRPVHAHRGDTPAGVPALRSRSDVIA